MKKIKPTHHRELEITLFRNILDRTADIIVRSSWEQLVSDLHDHHVTDDKTSGQLISGWTYRQTRCNEDAVALNVLILDYDGSATLDEAQTMFSAFENLIYTTWSHQSDRKHGRDCFRVLLPLATSVPKSEFLRRRIALSEVPIGADPVWRKPAQIYYLPSCPEDRRHACQVVHNKGEFMDVMKYEKDDEPITLRPLRHRSTPSHFSDREGILDALVRNGRLEYDDWFLVGCAMHCNGFEEHDFVTATVAGMKPSRSPEQAAKKWREIAKFCEAKPAFNLGIVFNVLKRGNARAEVRHA